MATLPSTEASRRIVTLDILRGVAVMGILAMNIVAFAMPFQAYANPLAYGADEAIDFGVFVFNFVAVEGKMRGLFSVLFGASMLLVALRAEAAGGSPSSVTYRRLAWLLVFGMAHYYLIWFGDILIGYALVGMVAWGFRRMAPRALIGWAVALVAVQLAVSGALASYAHSLAAAVAGASPSAADVQAWKGLSNEVGVPGAAALREDMALHLGPWTGIVEKQMTDKALLPLFFTFMFGWETLAYMLLGMAGLKSGFLTGGWGEPRYRKLALVCLAITVPAYLVLAALLFSDGFTVPGIFTYSFAASVPFRPVMVLAYAALIILATRHGGWLTGRIAAAGRAAFTNYLGTSIVMTFVFYGWGLRLYGSLGRAELWLVVLAMWAVMLAWSKPWLDRFAYGPIEWLWRSLARWKLQPMRKPLRAGAKALEA